MSLDLSSGEAAIFGQATTPFHPLAMSFFASLKMEHPLAL